MDDPLSTPPCDPSPEEELQEPLLVSPIDPTSIIPHKSRNISLTLWYQAIRCGGEAVWLGSVLAAYVYLLKPSQPETIGYLSALEGIVQFIAACVAGVLGDRFRRDGLLKVSSAIGITASLLIIISCIRSDLFICLVIALALNGAFDGIGLTASLAIFSDSIQCGERSHYFTLRSLCTSGGQIVGPTVSIVSFYLLGDQWTISACAKVIGGAQILLWPAFVLLCFLRDEHPHGLEENLVEGENSTNETSVVEERQDVPTSVEEEGGEDDPSTPEEETSPHNTIGLSVSRTIAISAAVSDMVCAVASGMSLRYFTIFQLDSLRLNPTIVNGLDALSFFLGGALMVGAQRWSTRWGRCRVSLVLKGLGAFFLLSMIVIFKRGRHPDELLLGGSVHTTVGNGTRTMVCLTYLLQNACLGSTSALTQSLVMDNVPSGERAKWSALESINIFGWCGSAAIGGILVKWFGGVLPVFFITVCMQLVGSLPLLGLVVLGAERMEGDGGEV